jgi:hypothetical protein
MSAATYNQPFPDHGRFVRCPESDSLEACSTSCGIAVEEWRPIATNDDSKIRASKQPVKSSRLDLQ